MTDLTHDQITRYLDRFPALLPDQREHLARCAAALELRAWLAVVDALAEDTAEKAKAARDAHVELVGAFCAGWAHAIGMCAPTNAPVDPFARPALWAQWPRC